MLTPQDDTDDEQELLECEDSCQVVITEDENVFEQMAEAL